MSDAEYIKLWLHGRPETTTREYLREIEKLGASIAPRSLLEAKLVDLQQHAATLKHMAPRSRGRAVAAIRSFYRFMVRAEVMVRSPAEALAMPKVPGGLAQRILTPDEVERLVRGGQGPYDPLLICTLYIAALRASELCGLKWKDLSVENSTLTVVGKGSKTGTVSIPRYLTADLLYMKPDGAKPTDPVFPSPTGRHLRTRQLLRIIKDAAAAAGLSPKVSPHWCRHSCLSHALDNGASLVLVRDHARHASVATTNGYLHAPKDDSAANYLGGRAA